MRPSRITGRVLGLHAALLAAGNAGKVVMLDDLSRVIMEEYGVSLAGTYAYVSTGEVLGLWREDRSQLAPGRVARAARALVILAPKPREESKVPL